MKQMKHEQVKKAKEIVMLSDLVGCYGTVWSNTGKLIHLFLVKGQIDSSNYLIQAVDSFSMIGNVCRIVHIDDMRNWYFYPTLDIANHCISDYRSQKENRHTFLEHINR